MGSILSLSCDLTTEAAAAGRGSSSGEGAHQNEVEPLGGVGVGALGNALQLPLQRPRIARQGHLHLRHRVLADPCTPTSPSLLRPARSVFHRLRLSDRVGCYRFSSPCLCRASLSALSTRQGAAKQARAAAAYHKAPPAALRRPPRKHRRSKVDHCRCPCESSLEPRGGARLQRWQSVLPNTKLAASLERGDRREVGGAAHPCPRRRPWWGGRRAWSGTAPQHPPWRGHSGRALRSALRHLHHQHLRLRPAQEWLTRFQRPVSQGNPRPVRQHGWVCGGGVQCQTHQAASCQQA